MINTRVKVFGTLKSGLKGNFSGNLDSILDGGKTAIVGRLPVYQVTKIESNPSKFERKWKE